MHVHLHFNLSLFIWLFFFSYLNSYVEFARTTDKGSFFDYVPFEALHWVFNFRLAFWTFGFFFGYRWNVVLRKLCDKFLDVHLESYEKNVKIHHTGFIVNSRCAILGCYASRCPRVVGLLW